MIKRRISALESVTKQMSVPKAAEYGDALERDLIRFLERIDGAEGTQENADKAIITAYETVHGKHANNGIYERYITKMNMNIESL